MENGVLRLTGSVCDCVMSWAVLPFMMGSIIGFIVAAPLLLMEYGKVVEMNEAGWG